MKKIWPLCALAAVLSLTGCHGNDTDNFASMNRADQQKALAGDKEKQKEMAAQIAAGFQQQAKEGGRPSGGGSANAAPAKQ